MKMSAGPTAKVPDPITLENRGESWKQFRREWKFYEIATKISKEEDDVRIAALMNVIGREGMDLFDTFQCRPAKSHGISVSLQKSALTSRSH